VLASPEGIQLSEAPNMFSELWLAINKIPLVPTEHDAASAIDRASIVILHFSNLVHEIVGNTDVVRVAEIVL
jgi:hypothetical protein